MKISELGGETALINLISRNYGSTGNGNLALGIGDDAALICFEDKYLLVTTDLLVEKTHFRMDINEAYLLGWKSAAVNISDIAAMGGQPTYSFVSIGLPDVDVDVVENIYQGMNDVSQKYGSVIAGGDTVGSECGIVINLTQMGIVEQKKAVLRTGAKIGDAIIVTNTIGDSLGGLNLLLKYGLNDARNISNYLVEKHLKPEPRVIEARAAVDTGKVHSMMDLSDGLSSDIKKLCAASKVGAKIFADKLPVSGELMRCAEIIGSDKIELAASGGEDYELLLTCSQEDVDEVINAISGTGSNACQIGEIMEGGSAYLIDFNGARKQMPAFWEHF